VYAQRKLAVDTPYIQIGGQYVSYGALYKQTLYKQGVSTASIYLYIGGVNCEFSIKDIADTSMNGCVLFWDVYRLR